MKKATSNTILTLALSLLAIAGLFSIGLWCKELGEPYITWFNSAWIGILVMAVLYLFGILKFLYLKIFK